MCLQRWMSSDIHQLASYVMALLSTNISSCFITTQINFDDRLWSGPQFSTQGRDYECNVVPALTSSGNRITRALLQLHCRAEPFLFSPPTFLSSNFFLTFFQYFTRNLAIFLIIIFLWCISSFSAYITAAILE